MNLFMFRLLLKPRSDLFALPFTREAWIRELFVRSRDFQHRTNDFYFALENGITYPPVIFGWIAREKISRERTSPSQGLEPTEHKGWQAAFFAIDPTHHGDGQKIAMEHSEDVGDPVSILESLVDSFNTIENRPFEASVHPIPESGSFRAFANEHNNQIKSITFDVSVPNMFNDENDFINEHRALRDRVNVSRAKTTLESDSSLNHTEGSLPDIIDYTERGGGKLYAVANDGEKYSSESHVKKVVIDVDHHKNGEANFLQQLLQFLDRIF